VADSNLQGKALLVARGTAVDVEEGLEATMDTWMGEENARERRILKEAARN
jgi:hypothetical protein